MPQSFPMDEEQYRALVANSSAWIGTGCRLLAAADVVWPRAIAALAFLRKAHEHLTAAQPGTSIQVDDIERLMQELHQVLTFRLLAGYAIENLLKGVVVRQRQLRAEPIVNAQGTLTGIRQDHDYLELARQVFGRQELSQDEERILSMLSVAVQWAGRYPMDKTQPDPTEWMTGRHLSDDYDAIHRLGNRIIRMHDSLK